MLGRAGYTAKRKGDTRAYLHRMCEHTSESERDFLGELLAMHCDFETVAKVDVHDLASLAPQHEVGRVAVSKTEYVADHAVDCERPGKRRTAFEPVFRVDAFKP